MSFFLFFIPCKFFHCHIFSGHTEKLSKVKFILSNCSCTETDFFLKRKNTFLHLLFLEPIWRMKYFFDNIIIFLNISLAVELALSFTSLYQCLHLLSAAWKITWKYFKIHNKIYLLHDNFFWWCYKKKVLETPQKIFLFVKMMY